MFGNGQFTNWLRSRQKATFSGALQANRNKVAERFFDEAGSLYVVLFDHDNTHWQRAFPVTADSEYTHVARMARQHHALPAHLSHGVATSASAFLEFLINQPEILVTPLPLPPTPSETSDTSDHSGPRQMDVDAVGPNPQDHGAM